MTVNLTQSQKDYAVFLPSISSFYVKFINNAQRRGAEYLDPARLPATFENGIDGFDFFQPDAYYNYKWGLYSAGHALLDTDKSDEQETMIQKRDRENSFILGDSGGFQIATGVIKCDWPNFKSDDHLRSTILNWLEHTSDYSMILDVPTLAAAPPLNEKTGLTRWQDCLDYTLHDNDYFVKHRKGNTKFLNVLQGNNEEQADIWYDAVKHYPFEGWAMAGYNMKQLHLALRRLIVLRDEKLLDPGRDVIHYLGTSKLEWATAFTAIQRNIRKTINPNMMVTFDAASPFITTAKGQAYSQHVHRNNKFSYVMEKAIDDKRFKDSKIAFPFNSPIGERLTMGDINYMGAGIPKTPAELKGEKFDENNLNHYIVPPDLNKIGKFGKSAWDTTSYFLLMAHNVYQHIESVQRANALADIACHMYKPSHKEWYKGKRGEGEFDLWVPRKVIFINNFIDELFASETPMQMLDEAEAMLTDFSGMKSIKTTENAFNNLFDTEEVANESDDDYTPEEMEAAYEVLENL